MLECEIRVYGWMGCSLVFISQLVLILQHYYYNLDCCIWGIELYNSKFPTYHHCTAVILARVGGAGSARLLLHFILNEVHEACAGINTIPLNLKQLCGLLSVDYILFMYYSRTIYE